MTRASLAWHAALPTRLERARHEDVEACRFWQVYHVTCTNSGRTDAGRRRKRERTGREASDDAVAG